MPGRGCPQEDRRNQVPRVLRQDKRGRQRGVRARHARRPAHPERWQQEEEVLDPVNYPNRLKHVPFSEPRLPTALPPPSSFLQNVYLGISLIIGFNKQTQCDGLLEHDVSGLIYPRRILNQENQE
jgi:hypothetical protein